MSYPTCPCAHVLSSKTHFALLIRVHFFHFIYMFQCWTAAPSSLPFKSFYWSTSSCVDSSRATRPLHYKRYIICLFSWSFIEYLICGSVQKTTAQQSPAALRAGFRSISQKDEWWKMLERARESEHSPSVLPVQISQVCQLCQQSPRLFTNHAAQLHTLLVSILNQNPLSHLFVQLCVLGQKKKEKGKKRKFEDMVRNTRTAVYL